MSWRHLFSKPPTLPPIRVVIRTSCGASYTVTTTSAAEAFETVEKFTDPRPGFTDISGLMDGAGTSRKINRAQVTSVFVEGLPRPGTPEDGTS